MFNVIALLLGLCTALYPQSPEKPAAKITENVTGSRIVRTPPRADEPYSRERDYRVRYFDMTDYERNKQNLDEKYSRRSYLREKMAKEIADFLADYEEYEILTCNYRRELYKTGNRPEPDNSANGIENNQNPSDNSFDESSYDNHGRRTEDGNPANDGNRSEDDNRTGRGGASGQSGKVYIPAPPETNRPRPLIPDDENNEQPGNGQKIPLPSDPDGSSYLIRD